MCDTGEVLAMVSLPDFDPNARRLTGGDSTRNIMAQDVYELGSVFKIFSFALALEDHTINLDEVFHIGQGYKIGKYTIHEAEHMPATLAARDILAQSSNIGTAQIALRSGGVRQRAVPGAIWACSSRSRPNCRKPPARFIPAIGARSRPPPSASARASRSARCASSPPPPTVVNGGRRITPTFLKQPTPTSAASR